MVKNTYSEVFPPPEVALKLEPEELALYLLRACAQDRQLLHVQNASNSNGFGDYCAQYQKDEMAERIVEAWVWLEREMLIAPTPGPSNGWCFITRRGKNFRPVRLEISL